MKILHAKILGEGPPLIILHGFLGMLDNWKTLGTRYAASGLNVHLVDQRNHGSSFWSDEFHYDAMAADLNAYMQYHGLDRAMVMGHSMGGKTAMQFACTHAEKVERLIIADIGPGFYPPHHDALLAALASLPLDSLASRSDADTELSRQITDSGVRQFLLKNLYWKEKGKLAFRCNLEVLQTHSAEVGEALNSTASFPGPALFIRGGNSEYVKESDERLIRTHFPAAVFKTIPGSGHWLHADQPEEFLRQTLDFIKS